MEKGVKPDVPRPRDEQKSRILEPFDTNSVLYPVLF